jgi:uncharacterized protein involved in exopolysaccharide biosynthesis
MNLDLYFYWKLFLRRLPIMALLVTVCAALGAFTAIRMPTKYSTSAILLVEEPQIPASMVESMVRMSATQHLDTIKQTITTRVNMIDMANEYDVFENIRGINPDEVVSQMRSATNIRTVGGRGRAIVMTITFTGRSGKVVADVVNQYVTLALEANIDFRMSRAESTLDFFQQEVDRLSAELDEQSARITAFKTENSGALPENQRYRLGQQALLQDRLSQLGRDLNTALAQQEDFKDIFETTGNVTQETRRQPRTAEEQRLATARTDLELALVVYSEDNPRVIQLRALITRLEGVVATQQGLGVETDVGEASPQEALFQAMMLEMDNRISTLRTDIERTSEEIETLEVGIRASSANEIQLDGLERELTSIQRRYADAAGNLNQARMSERIETTAQGRRITVIENATVPNAPSGSNQLRVVAAGAGVGLGLAGGFFMLLELLNRSIRRPAELVSRFNITPIVTIPYLESRGRRTIRRLSLIGATLIAIIGVPLVLWYIDKNYMPLDLFVQKVLSRLGIG